MMLCIQSLMKKLFLEEVSKMKKRLYDFFITRFYENMFLKAFITFSVSWTIFWLGFCIYHFISNF